MCVQMELLGHFRDLDCDCHLYRHFQDLDFQDYTCVHIYTMWCCVRYILPFCSRVL